MEKIEDAFCRIWDEKESKNKIHASLFNLIIYCPKSSRVHFFQDLVRSIISKFPCRIIFVIVDEKTTDDIFNVDVHAEIIPQGEMQICCEQITIEVSEKNHQRIPFIILPHLVPDLPIYLLWARGPFKDQVVLPNFLPFAKKIIFDSESVISVPIFLKSVVELLNDGKHLIGDLSWTVLRGWRKIIAAAFNSPDIFLQLKECKSINIFYNKYTQDTSQKNLELKAIYLQGWIAAQLNWHFEHIEYSEGIIHLNYQSNDNMMSIKLIPEDYTQLPAGIVTAVEVESHHLNGHIHFKRNPDNRQIAIQQYDSQQCYLPYLVNLPQLNPGQEILDDIFDIEAGQHYKNMINLVSHINWQG